MLNIDIMLRIFYRDFKMIVYDKINPFSGDMGKTYFVGTLLQKAFMIVLVILVATPLHKNVVTCDSLLELILETATFFFTRTDSTNMQRIHICI